MKKMENSIRRQAYIILEELDYLISIDWNFREKYLEAIIRGLKKKDFQGEID